MQIRKLAPYLLQGIFIGLALGAFLILLFDGGSRTSPVKVEFKEAAPTATKNRPSGDRGPVSYADAVSSAAPAVVNIYTTKIVTQRPHPLLQDPLFRRFFGDRRSPLPRRRLENSLGSGVIVSGQGYIITNHHVISNAEEILVALIDGRSSAATVVGTDSDTDLAVLHIDISDLPTMTLGHSDALRVGDVVLAIGNPFGVGQTVTMGIVSGTGRSRLGISTYEDFIQTDAAINPGNSGGALINAGGDLVGINTAIFSQSGGSQGVGFAIPVDLARDVMKQIIETGQVVRGWLGVEAQDITPQLADSFGLTDTHGVLVAGVSLSGPAAKAGLEAGDIILAIDNKSVADARQIMNDVADIAPGTKVRIEIQRRGEKQRIDAIIGERPQNRER